MPIHSLGYVNNGEKHEIPVISALPREMTMAEFALLSDAEKLGDIIVTDYPVNEESDYVEVVADGVKTYSALLDELFSIIDVSRLSSVSSIYYVTSSGTVHTSVLRTKRQNDTILEFISPVLESVGHLYFHSLTVQQSSSKIITIDLSSTATHTDNSSSVLASGNKFRLYYNDAHTFDFNTKAENCIYGNSNVKDALDKLDIYKTYNLSDSMYYGVTSHSGMWYIFYIPLFPVESGDVVSLSLSDVSIYIGGSIYSVSDLSLADTEIRIGDMGIRIDLKFTSAHSIDTFGILRVNSNGGTMTVSKQ